jgi:hypothetical protein
LSCLRTSLGLLLHGPLGLAPKGLQASAQGFKGTLKMEGSPCKGERCEHAMNLAPIAVQKLEW